MQGGFYLNNLSKLLKTYRAESNMSLRDFSAYLGISHAYLSKLEKGFDSNTGKEIAPTIDTLLKISDGLNIPHAKFLEMCGYIDKPNKVFKEADLSNKIDIESYIDKTLEFLYKNNFTFEDKLLSKEDIENIISSLRVAAEISYMKFRKK